MSRSQSNLSLPAKECLTSKTSRIGLLVVGILAIGVAAALYFSHVNAITAYVIAGTGIALLLTVAVASTAKKKVTDEIKVTDEKVVENLHVCLLDGSEKRFSAQKKEINLKGMIAKNCILYTPKALTSALNTKSSGIDKVLFVYTKTMTSFDVALRYDSQGGEGLNKCIENNIPVALHILPVSETVSESPHFVDGFGKMWKYLRDNNLISYGGYENLDNTIQGRHDAFLKNFFAED